MKPFHFSLKAVLTLRTRKEREALEKHARALSDLREAEQAMAACQGKLMEAIACLREATAQGCVAAKLVRDRNYEQFMQLEVQNSVEAVRQVQARAGEALKEVLFARQQREAVEQLRARQLDQHRREQERESQRILDEMALTTDTPGFEWQNTEEVAA